MPDTTLAAILGADFEREAETTRRILDGVPEDKLAWKPHEKSMTLGRLATHVAELPDWGATIVEQDEQDMAKEEFNPVTAEDRGELLAIFEKSRETFAAALKDRSDEHMTQNWRLRMGEHVIFELPRTVCLRDFVLSHVTHHRAQLGVYHRLLDAPVPGLVRPRQRGCDLFGQSFGERLQPLEKGRECGFGVGWLWVPMSLVAANKTALTNGKVAA